MIQNPLKHLGRHRQMIGLLYKYGRSDLVQQSGLLEEFGGHRHDDPDEWSTGSHDWSDVVGDAQGNVPDKHSSKGTSPDDLASDLESMGPAYIKLGQLLSTRPDFLPKPYRDALSRLQDDAEPIDTKAVFYMIEKELGKQPDQLFRSFEIEPLATASLAQVHRAITHDGRQVVVKVQRPGMAEQLADDIEAMEQLATFCERFEFGRKYQLRHLVQSLKQSLREELDYENEICNSATLQQNLQRFENVIVPQPVEALSTSRVITMEYVEFEKITELPAGRLSSQRSCQLADELFESFLYQVLVHGAFHADPHPGNVGLTERDQIVLLDHGLVVKVPSRLQSQLIRLLLAICDGDGSTAAKVAESCSVVGDEFDPDIFRNDIERVVAENINRSIDRLDAGAALMEIQQVSGKHDVVLPQEVILLGRALMQLERVVASLNPKFDPNDAIHDRAMAIMRQHSGQKLTLSSVYQSFLETTEFVQKLPARANELAELITTNRLAVKVDAFDDRRFIRGLDKVANRISTGLIISAMIVAGALMMNIESGWQLFGYPIVALIFLVLAGVSGSILVWRVIVSDRFEQ